MGRGAKAIMIQGTMSNAGKSLLTAGLCRIFKQDGYRTAPFKSQNMALNSYITSEGLEMGRAQVMQAEAAGIEPSVLMNPILLKPTNDTGSQVIVNGEVRGNMSAREYFARKKELIPDILKAYHALEEAYDILVIEGAGSPAEINLKQDDIVNMGMAKMANAPVLLVGDIDRGGVFAQLAGTVMLLEEQEKNMVKGIIINKFRGDKTILDPGTDMLEELTSIPVVGVTPYMQVDIEDEDSLTERFYQKGGQGKIEIAVIRLPRISNFTDFAVLEGMEEVNVRYVDRADGLGEPDMIILPGTKNTMGDLKWLRESGLEAALLKAEGKGCVLFGICGGYQMLGEFLEDPEGIEEGGSLRGMGLLPVHTVFGQEKTRTRAAGNLGNLTGVLSPMSGMEVEGYEIHMGKTRGSGDALPFSTIRESGKEGQGQPDGRCVKNVYGTYVHGIFDRDGVAEKLAGILAKRKGATLEGIRHISRKEYKERQYDLLADTLRQHLDMEQIYRILEEGIEQKNVAVQKNEAAQKEHEMHREPEQKSSRVDTGRIHIYEGDGKGKSTAAVGLSIRFAGTGGKVLFTQFLKGDNSGELGMLAQTKNIHLIRCEKSFGFTFRMTPEQKQEAAAYYSLHLKKVLEQAAKEQPGLLVLDESIGAYNQNMIEQERLIQFLKEKPPELEVVLTGRNPAPELLELADYVTCMEKKKHPYDKGIGARKGIEL